MPAPAPSGDELAVTHRKVAVITGASSGIGEAIALRLARAGTHVALVARRAERLLRLQRRIQRSGGTAEVIVADLSLAKDRSAVHRRAGQADILINNAGLGWYGYYSEMPWCTAQELLQVNIAAAAHLIRLFLPGMRRRGSGHIINIGSIAGSIPSQGVALYAGSKSFLDAFSTALHRETRGSGVRASVVRAGPVTTEFYAAALSGRQSRRIPAERFGVSAAHVAARVWELIQHPRRVIYVPRWLRIVPWVELTLGWLEDLIGPALLRRPSI